MTHFDPEAPGDADAGIFGLPAREDAKVVLVPVPFDATASYGRRTHLGPKAIYDASLQVDLFDIEYGRAYEAGIQMIPAHPEVAKWNLRASALVDRARDAASTDDSAGVLSEINDLGERVRAHTYEVTKHWLNAGRIVGTVGGDHSTPLGAIAAYAERYPALGILHIDAHADLRESYEGFTYSHASIMYNVLTKTSVERVVQVGVRDFAESEARRGSESGGRVITFFDHDLAQRCLEAKPFSETVSEIVALLPQEVYVSFDIDGLDPTLCPGTGTPVPGGLSFAQACALLNAVKRSGRRIVGFDLNEVAPRVDDEWDANVGARMLYKLCGAAITSNQVRT